MTAQRLIRTDDSRAGVTRTRTSWTPLLVKGSLTPLAKDRRHRVSHRGRGSENPTVAVIRNGLFDHRTVPRMAPSIGAWVPLETQRSRALACVSRRRPTSELGIGPDRTESVTRTPDSEPVAEDIWVTAGSRAGVGTAARAVALTGAMVEPGCMIGACPPDGAGTGAGIGAGAGVGSATASAAVATTAPAARSVICPFTTGCAGSAACAEASSVISDGRRRRDGRLSEGPGPAAAAATVAVSGAAGAGPAVVAGRIDQSPASAGTTATGANGGGSARCVDPSVDEPKPPTATATSAIPRAPTSANASTAATRRPRSLAGRGGWVDVAIAPRACAGARSAWPDAGRGRGSRAVVV